ncbi:ThiJ/PfpI family protein [Phytophthora palmivora]|uniref:ThiJ/PfpI family protein n=1 Tax=Phytophthora palmivora TaxID=4796 RepID=A0A2P4XK57_9STRA|nr:ThiJ/PfpI family protein [Phytophthora palmivora]
MPLYATHGFEDVTEHIDILVIPGGSPGRLAMQKHEAFMKFLKNTADTATNVLTVFHPMVNWIHKARWVQDGKIWTSSGVTAGMDMAHAFMMSMYGEDVATVMARYMENVPNTDPNDDPFATV